MEEVVLHEQNFIDMSLQANGTLEAVVLNAFANNRSVTDPLEAGETINLVTTENDNVNVVNFYKAYTIQPATELSDEAFDIVDNEDPCNLCKCFT